MRLTLFILLFVLASEGLATRGKVAISIQSSERQRDDVTGPRWNNITSRVNGWAGRNLIKAGNTAASLPVVRSVINKAVDIGVNQVVGALNRTAMNEPDVLFEAVVHGWFLGGFQRSPQRQFQGVGPGPEARQLRDATY